MTLLGLRLPAVYAVRKAEKDKSGGMELRLRCILDGNIFTE